MQNTNVSSVSNTLCSASGIVSTSYTESSVSGFGCVIYVGLGKERMTGGGAAGSALAAGAAARGVRGEVPGAAEGRRAAGGDRDGGGRV